MYETKKDKTIKKSGSSHQTFNYMSSSALAATWTSPLRTNWVGPLYNNHYTQKSPLTVCADQGVNSTNNNWMLYFCPFYKSLSWKLTFWVLLFLHPECCSCSGPVPPSLLAIFLWAKLNCFSDTLLRVVRGETTTFNVHRHTTHTLCCTRMQNNKYSMFSMAGYIENVGEVHFMSYLFFTF